MLVLRLLVWVNLLFAVIVIFSSNFLYSILSLVFLVITGCFFLIMLEMEFLPFIVMLLYIGAVSVLFLFVVMMLQINKNNYRSVRVSFLAADGLLYLLLTLKFIILSLLLNQGLSSLVSAVSYQFTTYYYETCYMVTSSQLIGGDSVFFLSLFTQKYYFFILIGIIILFTMVGSIVLCLL